MKAGEKSSDTQLLKLNKEIMLPAAVNVRWSCNEKKHSSQKKQGEGNYSALASRDEQNNKGEL